MRYVLNTPVLTSYGTFKFTKATLQEARHFVSNEFTSAVGHASTAKLLTDLLGVEIPCNRVAIEMYPGDEALVVRLKIRIEEGRVLSYDELIDLYENGMIEFGILKKLD